MASSNVLRVNSVEEQSDYRNAVAEVIRRILMIHETTLVEISERIDVSLGTISNAANKKADLNAIYLLRLGKAYGPQTLDPCMALFGARGVPIDADEVDPLPSLTMAAHVVARARTHSSPGGAAETPCEQSAMLPVLEEAQTDLSAKIVSIRRRLHG